MCGRYTLTSSGESSPSLRSSGAAPAAAALQHGPHAGARRWCASPEAGGRRARRLDLLKWGLIPYWAKEASIGNRMINARAESVAEKPAYRCSFKKKRCLVATDGFYEWKKEGKAKQPFLIRRQDRKPFAFAGLWSTWKDPEQGGEPVETFTILTTGANDLIRPLHDRMPVIVDRENFDLWLDPKMEDAAKLQPLLVAHSEEGFEPSRSAKLVNSPANEVAGCIEPLMQD